jgi:hypothetical protein
MIAAVAAFLSLAAAASELMRPASQRRWHGRIFGVPYDFRPPSLRRVRDAWWAPADHRLLVPRSFGLGWDLNLGRIWHLLRTR